MKPRIMLLLALACGALLVLCTRSPEPEESSEPAQSKRLVEPGKRARAHRPQESAAQTEPLHAVAPAERPQLPSERVEFDRRPWNPKAELRERYEVRARIVDAWDRFRAKTGISDERAQALLMKLYDVHENKKYLTVDLHKDSPYQDHWLFERRLAEVNAMQHGLYLEADHAVQTMLSREEYRVWRRTVERTGFLELLGVWDLFAGERKLVDMLYGEKSKRTDLPQQ